MKVLQVIDTLKVGGAERVLVTLTNLLFEGKVDVSVLIISEDGGLVKDINSDIPIIRLKRTKRFDRSKMKEFSQILSNYDIIHTHLKHNFRYTSIVAKIFNKHHVKIILHDHSHYDSVSKLSLKYLKDSLFKNILKPKYYIGVSTYNCDWAKKELLVNEKNFFLLENIIKKKAVNKTNHKKKGMVLVSNITPIKNIEFALEIVKKLKEKLTVYGRVIDEEYFKMLHQKIKQYEIEDQVVFISDCNEVQQELYQYKYAIHTSFKETGPLVLIEYLAQSLPFLSFNSGQVYNKINDQLPQFFIDNYHTEKWLNKINNLSSVPEETISKTYKNNFSSEEYLKKCLKIYKNILNS